MVLGGKNYLHLGQQVANGVLMGKHLNSHAVHRNRHRGGGHRNPPPQPGQNGRRAELGSGRRIEGR